MPNIKPISDLRNYTEVLKEVDTSKRVYLTRNGKGEYAIMRMEEIDELDKLKDFLSLQEKLQAAENESNKLGWLDSADVKKELGIGD